MNRITKNNSAMSVGKRRLLNSIAEVKSFIQFATAFGLPCQRFKRELAVLTERAGIALNDSIYR